MTTAISILILGVALTITNITVFRIIRKIEELRDFMYWNRVLIRDLENKGGDKK